MLGCVQAGGAKDYGRLPGNRPPTQRQSSRTTEVMRWEGAKAVKLQQMLRRGAPAIARTHLGNSSPTLSIQMGREFPVWGHQIVFYA